MIIIDGKKVAKEIYNGIKQELLPFFEQKLQPKIVVILVGDDPASLAYISAKRKKAEELGLKFEVLSLPAEMPQDEICRRVVDANRIAGICGIVVQLPLPAKIEKQQVLDCVLPSLDVDGLGSANQTKLYAGGNAYMPPAPAAIMEIFKQYNIDLSGKHVLLIGAGDLIGKPLMRLLAQQSIPVSIVTEHTKDAAKLTKNADVIITAVGKPKIVTGRMVKKNAVIIDAGTSFEIKSGKIKLVGDVDFESVKKKAAFVTPVPGGVGPVTVAMLYKNLLNSCKKILN